MRAHMHANDKYAEHPFFHQRVEVGDSETRHRATETITHQLSCYPGLRYMVINIILNFSKYVNYPLPPPIAIQPVYII